MAPPTATERDGAAGDKAEMVFKAFMQGFYDLTSTDTAQRLQAAGAIISYAEAAPMTPTAATTKAVDRPALYAVNRLLRGVCSGREAARQGFAACAAEMLAVIPVETVSTQAAFDTLMEATKIAGSLRSHEERDLSLGRLFGCAALARSGRLAESEDLCVRALGAVAPLYWRRRWMRQAVGQVLLLIAEQLGYDAFVERALPLILPLLAPDAAPTAATAAAAGGKKRAGAAGEGNEEEDENSDADSENAAEEADDGEGDGDGGGGGDLDALKVSELSADQLVIALGLQRLLLRHQSTGNGSSGAAGAAADKEISAAAKLPKALRKFLLVTENIDQLMQPLVASASSFPKVHAVWGEVWRQLGMDPVVAAAALTAGESGDGLTDVPVIAVPARCKALGASEETLKVLWERVVDGRLANGSHNTKGLSLLLLQQVLPLVPASAVSTLLSPSVARILANHAASPEATLHGMAAACLESLPKLTSDDSAARAAVVAALVAPGGSSSKLADSRLGTGTLAGLADGLDEAALLAHVETLIGAATAPIDAPDSADSSNSRAGLPAVEALYALTKTIDAAPNSTSGTASVSCDESARNGKAGNGDYSSEWCGRIANFFLECGFFQPAATVGNGARGSTDASKVSTDVREACRARFFSLVADVGRRPLLWRSARGNAAGGGDAGKGGSGGLKRPRSRSQEALSSAVSAVSEPGALEVIWRLHAHWDALVSSGRQLLKQHRPNEEEIDARKQALAMVAGIRGRAAAAEPESSSGSGGAADGGGGGGGASGRVEAGLSGVILHVSLQLLAADPEMRARAADHLLSLLDVCRQLAPATNKAGKGAKQVEKEGEKGEEEEGADPMALLADVLTGVLSSPAGGLVRGLRDVVKRAWGAVVVEVPAGAAAVGVLRAAVCGEDGEVEEGEDGDDGAEDEEDEEDDSDEDGASDDGSDGETAATKMLASNGASAKIGKPADDNPSDEQDGDDSSDGDEGNEEEVTVGGDVLAELLGKGGSDGSDGSDSDSEDDEEGGLQHNAGADHALAAMLALKQLGRKAGRAQAERESAQASLRALDLLEVLCSKQPDNPHLPSLLPAVYSAVKRLASGATATPDGRALYGRLVALFSSRLCKAKPRGIDPETTGEGAWSPAEGTAFFLAEASRLDKRGSSGRKAGRGNGNSDDHALAAMATLGLFACVRVAMTRADAAAAAASAAAPIAAGGKKAGGGKGGKMDKGAVKADTGSVEPEDAAAATADAAAVAAAVAEALRGYLSQRRSSAAAGQRFTEMLRRAPALGPELMPTLLEAAATAQTDFLRAEAVRLLSEPLSQRKAMSPSARAKLISQGPLMAKALAGLLNPNPSDAATAAAPTASATNEDMDVAGSGSGGKTGKKAGRAKRLKPVLASCGALLKLEVEARGSGNSGDGGLSDADLEQLAAAVRAAGEVSESAPLTAMCRGVAAKAEGLTSGGGGVTSGGGSQGEKKAKKGRKRQESSSRKDADAEGRGSAAAGAVPAASALSSTSEDATASKSARKKQKRALEAAAAAEAAVPDTAVAAMPAGSARKGRTRSSSDLAATGPVAPTPARKSGGKRASAADEADLAAAVPTPVVAKGAVVAETTAASSAKGKRRKVQK